MSTFDMLSDFPALDELIQVIYQGAHKFIVLSQVTDSAWTIHLSLAGSEGRWWTGKWTAADVLDFAVRVTFNAALCSLTRCSRRHTGT